MSATAELAAGCAESTSGATLGSQVVLDLYECDPQHLDDLEWVKATLVHAAQAAGATVVQTVFHKFAPCGISGVVVIAESHLAIHIWPEMRYAAVDVFTCGESVQLDVAVALLRQAFGSRRVVHHRFIRGNRAFLRPDHAANAKMLAGLCTPALS